jgi:hypothetical protein
MVFVKLYFDAEAVMLPQINASNVFWEVTVANTQF